MAELDRINSLEIRRKYVPIAATWHIIDAEEGPKATLCSAGLGGGDTLRDSLYDHTLLFEREVCDACIDKAGIYEQIATWNK